VNSKHTEDNTDGEDELKSRNHCTPEIEKKMIDKMIRINSEVIYRVYHKKAATSTSSISPGLTVSTR
jgi:hypothetical protein